MNDKKEPFVEKEKIATAIGLIIDQWNGIEVSLGSLFAFMVGLPHEGEVAFLSRRILFTPTNFHTQLTMVTVAIEHRIKDDRTLKEWQSIRNKLVTVKQGRDACAHCAIAMDNERNTHIAMANVFTKKFDKPQGQMTLADIDSAREEIRLAGIELAKFVAAALEPAKGK
jgi:hypothetical protein